MHQSNYTDTLNVFFERLFAVPEKLKKYEKTKRYEKLKEYLSKLGEKYINNKKYRFRLLHSTITIGDILYRIAHIKTFTAQTYTLLPWYMTVIFAFTIPDRTYKNVSFTLRYEVAKHSF